jgi:hypothetical protein
MAAGFNPRLLFWATIDKIKGLLGLSPLFIPAVGRPDEFALLNTPSAHPGSMFFVFEFNVLMAHYQGLPQCSLKETFRLPKPRTSSTPGLYSNSCLHGPADILLVHGALFSWSRPKRTTIFRSV